MVIKTKKNYYDILGVTPDSDENEVKHSYRQLARKYHPDINKSPESASRFKDILEAYEILSDEEKRKQYDMLNGFYKTPKNYFKNTCNNKEQESYKEKDKDRGAESDTFTKSENSSTNNQKGTSNFKSTYNSKDNETKNKKIFKDTVNSILDEISKNHSSDKKKNEHPKDGNSINTEITISIPEAINGTERILNILHKELCPHCKGRKFINNSKCPKCNGTGAFELTRKITVKIPAGVKDNSKLRLKGEGNPGFFGGKNGDLFIKLRIEKSNNLEIEGNNILYNLTISPFEAVLGSEIEIPCTNENVKLTIPPMTQSGQKFQISNKGIKTNGKFGDMIVTVQIQIPKNLSDDEITLYNKLKKLSRNDLRN